MAFDFPNSPTEGQIYSPSGGPTYVFNSPRWKAMGQGQIAIISDSAPANPANGQLWWESDTGILFIWVNDGNSSQWVQCGGITAGGAIVQTIITSSGTYTKPAGLRYLEVTLVGGGGGSTGGGATAAGQSSAGGGGGGAGTCIKLYAASDLAASEVYTLGAGGGSPGGSGAAGGTSTFKGLTAGGGAQAGANNVGGAVSGTTVATAGSGNGASASGGDLNIDGGNGFAGLRGFPTAVNATRGIGGSSALTTQGIGGFWFIGSTSPGSSGRFPGGGADGGGNGPSQAVASGAGGGNGCIIFKEFF